VSAAPQQLRHALEPACLGRTASRTNQRRHHPRALLRQAKQAALAAAEMLSMPVSPADTLYVAGELDNIHTT